MVEVTANTPYKEIDELIIPHRDRVFLRDKIQQLRREQTWSLEPGDCIIYDPYNPSSVSTSWKGRIGCLAKVTKRGDRWTKIHCIFEGERMELRPSPGNIYLASRWLSKPNWEV